jgi:two-component system, chemotaxis family, protein-glutamate methylesterase/glutaminase
MKILIAEDDPVSAFTLKRILGKEGHSIITAGNGADALKGAKQEQFDIVCTDWMMPEMDGIELIHRLRAEVKPVPLIMMITALDTAQAREHSLRAGADEYFAKPIDAAKVILLLNQLLARSTQPLPQRPLAPSPAKVATVPKKRVPFIGVAVAASTGGPVTLAKFFTHLPPTRDAAFFVVQHGPGWMLQDFVQSLQRRTKLPIHLGENGMAVDPGNVYLAGGDGHLVVEPNTMRLRVDKGPPENHVIPAADPLFRSVAATFGNFSVGAVLTGLGRDGALGCSAIADAGGIVMAQDPSTAVAPSMPQSVVDLQVARTVLDVPMLAQHFGVAVTKLYGEIPATIRHH